MRARSRGPPPTPAHRRHAGPPACARPLLRAPAARRRYCPHSARPRRVRGPAARHASCCGRALCAFPANPGFSGSRLCGGTNCGRAACTPRMKPPRGILPPAGGTSRARKLPHGTARARAALGALRVLPARTAPPARTPPTPCRAPCPAAAPPPPPGPRGRGAGTMQMVPIPCSRCTCHGAAAAIMPVVPAWHLWFLHHSNECTATVMVALGEGRTAVPPQSRRCHARSSGKKPMLLDKKI